MMVGILVKEDFDFFFFFGCIFGKKKKQRYKMTKEGSRAVNGN